MMNSTILDSKFIIDGVPMELSPRQILGGTQLSYPPESIIDESLDPSVGAYELDGNRMEDYLAMVRGLGSRKLLFPFAGEYARARVAFALLDALCSKGHFVLEDLNLSVELHWTDKGVGSMAAFYWSVAGLADYAADLYLQIAEHSLVEGEPRIDVKVAVPEPERALPSCLVPDPQSWLVYVPFDTSEYRLGGSLLAQALGVEGGPAPKIEGLLRSGARVCRGWDCHQCLCRRRRGLDGCAGLDVRGRRRIGRRHFGPVPRCRGRRPRKSAVFRDSWSPFPNQGFGFRLYRC